VRLSAVPCDLENLLKWLIMRFLFYPVRGGAEGCWRGKNGLGILETKVWGDRAISIGNCLHPDKVRPSKDECRKYRPCLALSGGCSAQIRHHNRPHNYQFVGCCRRSWKVMSSLAGIFPPPPGVQSRDVSGTAQVRRFTCLDVLRASRAASRFSRQSRSCEASGFRFPRLRTSRCHGFSWTRRELCSIICRAAQLRYRVARPTSDEGEKTMTAQVMHLGMDK
jgi:hypothetical protein